jgi:hypothetical protein
MESPRPILKFRNRFLDISICHIDCGFSLLFGAIHSIYVVVGPFAKPVTVPSQIILARRRLPVGMRLRI